MSITEDDHLVAFDFLVATKANVIATLLRSSGRAITVDDADVKVSGLLQGQHRVCEHGVDAAIRLPPAKGAVDSRVVNLGLALYVLVDWQLLPLATDVEELQNVVEDCVRCQFRDRPARSIGKVRQDKSFELQNAQFRRNTFYWLRVSKTRRNCLFAYEDREF